jgi:hypothetical protein
MRGKPDLHALQLEWARGTEIQLESLRPDAGDIRQILEVLAYPLEQSLEGAPRSVGEITLIPRPTRRVA